MSTSPCELDFLPDCQFVISPQSDAHVLIEDESQSEPNIAFACDKVFFPGMAKVPENISDVIVKRLSEIAHVKAVLMGKSGDVYHVWTMVDEWSVAGRKAVYAAQKELLLKLSGFDLDFYVVPVDEGEAPEELVSDIPIVWERAA